MSLYTTPLQFGYFFSLLFWIIFLARGYQNQRISDRWLGWIMFILAMELQDYTFGFSGINNLWNELNGFPRGVSLLFGPIVYFYFKSQVNRNFRLKRKYLIHFAPYALYFLYEISAFVQGVDVVQQRQESTLNHVLGYVLMVTRWASYIFYLTHCLIIYKRYRKWSLQQFSNTELINFSWFRNFVYVMIFWLLFREIMNIVDAFLNLDFYQDWWWNLSLVLVAIYIGLAGYSQRQPAKIFFEVEVTTNKVLNPKNKEQKDHNEVIEISNRLTSLMKNDKLYLQPDLNLQELAQHLQVNSVKLSTSINQAFNLNFNDYINGLRISEFVKLYEADSARKFTMLSLALDSGFNSKATFNRAFKKIKGTSPKEFLSS